MTHSLAGPALCCSRMQNEEWNAAGQGTKGHFASFPPKHLKGHGEKLLCIGEKVKVEEVYHVTELSQPLPTLPKKQLWISS